MSRFIEVFERLAALVEARRGADAQASYTAQLLADPARAAKKLGEEAVEAVIAATERNQDDLTSEAADVLYHLLVMLEAAEVPLDAVMDELEGRTRQTGLQEKASRPAE